MGMTYRGQRISAAEFFLKTSTGTTTVAVVGLAAFIAAKLLGYPWIEWLGAAIAMFGFVGLVFARAWGSTGLPMHPSLRGAPQRPDGANVR